MKKFIAGIALAGSMTMTTAIVPDMMKFGSLHDVEYAALLWEVMNASNLAGPHAIQTYPYEGMAPHGIMFRHFIPVPGLTVTLVI
ncbi:MAG: hypothetical protein ABGW81_00110 [Paracoccaceae bacterium]